MILFAGFELGANLTDPFLVEMSLTTGYMLSVGWGSQTLISAYFGCGWCYSRELFRWTSYSLVKIQSTGPKF